MMQEATHGRLPGVPHMINQILAGNPQTRSVSQWNAPLSAP